MTMENFKTELSNKLQTLFGDNDCVFFENDIIQGVPTELITINLADEDRHCATPISTLYQLKLRGMSISEIANAVKFSLLASSNIDREHIIFRLVNAAEKEEQLKTIPHIPFYDMAITFQCVIFSEESRGFLTISQELMEKNSLTLRQLVDLALENTFRLFPCHATPLIFHMLKGLMEDKDTTLKDFQEFAMQAFCSKETPIFQATCTNYPGGSTAMLNTAFLSQIAYDMGHDLLLLPGTDQAFAILPFVKEMDKDTVHQMVDDALSQGDEPILTRYAFLFSRKTKRLGVFV